MPKDEKRLLEYLKKAENKLKMIEELRHQLLWTDQDFIDISERDKYERETAQEYIQEREGALKAIAKIRILIDADPEDPDRVLKKIISDKKLFDRFKAALIAMGEETVSILIDHPIAKILIAGVKAFLREGG